MMSATRVTTIVSAGERADQRRRPATSGDENEDRLAEAHVEHVLRGDDVDEAIIEPTERSMPPEMITIACPHAAKRERQRVDRERLHVERPPRHGRLRAPVEDERRAAARRRRPSSRAGARSGASRPRRGAGTAVVASRDRLVLDEPVHRAEQRRLVGRRAGQLGGDRGRRRASARGRRRAGTRPARWRRRGSRAPSSASLRSSA